MVKFSAFFRLIRWFNLLIIVLMQYLTAIFLVGPKENWEQIIKDESLFLVVLSTFFIAAAGYIINDYFDVKIDLMNKPNKVIIGKLIRRRNAILAHQFFNFFGIIAGILVSTPIGILNFIAASTLWFYSERFKRQAFIGNFLVALLTFLSVFIIGIYFGKGRRIILIYALFAFMITLIREIIKDLEDIRGDAKYGCRTLPIIWGIRKTKGFVFFLILIFMIEVVVLSIPINSFNLYVIFGLLFFPFIIMVRQLYFADKKKDFSKLSIFSKIIMIVGVLSMIFYK